MFDQEEISLKGWNITRTKIDIELFRFAQHIGIKETGDMLSIPRIVTNSENQFSPEYQ